ncbi:MurR/RpiR family transcriptional regulator [Nocardioides sp. NPDC101246]|uniref:MurR/RpiR family transcriptional regulator n=1 Tax=Nocardioides sp. NPDC101246 TaxID=3364336 RepID=UPI003827B67B
MLAEITPEQLLFMSAAELGSTTRTSNATVVRTLQALGYAGLAELKGGVAGPFTSSTAPDVRARRRIEATGGNLENVWERVTTEAIERIDLLRHYHSPEAYAAAVELIHGARQVATFGFGASSVVAEQLALKLRRVGRSSRPIRGSGFQLADEMLSIERGDVLVLFAPGRLPRDTQVLLDRVRAVGASSVLVTDELLERLEDVVTVTIHAPNTPTGMTAETLSTMAVADALVQGVAAFDIEHAVQTSHTLTTIRQQLGF